MNLLELPPVSAPLPWQSGAWNRLQEQLTAGQLPHALLLAGPADIGKARLALALARLLLCHRPAAGHNCGDCPGCRFSQSGSHGDFRWLQPEGKSKVIKIEQVREAVAFAFRTAGFGSRKVLVLAPAETMTTNAANALLKCLEEPAGDTHIILVCQRLQGVPATVRSRCQLLKMPLPPAEECLPWLDHLTGTRAASVELLQLAAGMPLRAERLYRESGVDSLQARRAGLRSLAAGEPVVAQVVTLFSQLEPALALEEIAGFVQQQLRLQGADALPSCRAQFRLLDRLQGLRGAIAAGSNPNPQLVLENALIGLRGCFGELRTNATMATLIGEMQT
ncbi:DNA polymerase III subunit delta' [Haliea sp. E1-2-M8]|uniref:DNA polymerase III subunit delta' n=1 Tax=Haliea sp. E1-2-M8 TaxID=3064706 RepID=UPI00271EA668|nr:DNA polymerase III subunit delta' [Haliea sp. E1-2-M8]MDO8862329.1 DNA polymerase III subunit delta' [Haliea sp. E1-2-M8]